MVPSAFLHPFASPTRGDFISIVRGDGVHVWDADGNRLVDGFGSLWYANVGHGRAEIADAVARQMGELEAWNTFDRYTNPVAEELCERIASLAPIGDPRVFLADSGSEAVDTAVKLVRAAMILRGSPQRALIVARDGGYHGTTLGGTSLQGLVGNREGFGPLPADVVHVDRDDLSSAERLFAERGDEVAAVISEPVIGAGGVFPPTSGYLEGLRRLCDEHDAYLILDEVVCAFGRLGYWWGADRYGIRPDLVTFAKGVTSGYLPLGGVLVGPSVRGPLEADPDYVLRHGFTYSGHPSCCAAGLANIDIIEREALSARALEIESTLGELLDELHVEGLVPEVRGAGAMWAVAMPDGVAAPEVQTAMYERGAIARALGPDALGFCPPLIMGDDDLGFLVGALGDALADAPAPP